MSRLINAEAYEQSLIENGWDEGDDEFFPDGIFELLKETPTVKAISLDKIKKAREQIIDEKDFAYADFEQYKEEVLHAEPDELPDDDFRYGMERCLEILNKLIAESEKDAVVIKKSLCDSCLVEGCIFQSGIIRNHCDFYKAESEG